MTDHAKIRERIRILRARTAARGCSEAEAMEAAAKAAEMMAAHGLDEGDIAFVELAARMRTQGKTPRDGLWGTVATCTSTVPTLTHDTMEMRMVYLGREPGPEIAVYLHEMLDRAVDREIATFKTTPFYKRRRTVATKRQAVADFTDGLVGRLSRRLLDLFRQTVISGGEARKAAAAERDRRHKNLATIKQPDRKRRFDDAAAAGHRAGDRIAISRGIGGPSGAPLLITQAE